ncbi:MULTISPECIES: ATP-binding protein [Arthrobacter]|uniref:ATP-binding protein n=2 Tax=Arthrobacter TaxID=1663 RepID=A0ABU9KR29_9MICC|nr:ATP-binding protein [Arthrobacter sp. YJM1]MDP5228524.1 ATP-binding protein [Arthrobacter sp. YJM1]
MSGDGVTVKIGGLATPAFVEDVLDTLDSLWEATPFVPDEDRTLFMLAVSEVTTNIAQHGGDGVHVEAQFSVDGNQLIALLRDTAPPAGLDPGPAVMPGTDCESGRGLALTLAVLDDFQHDGAGDGNVWTLRRTFSRA